MLKQVTVEQGTIVREIHVEAPPDVVFEVVTSPDHLREWWPDDAVVEPTPGFEGELVFGERGTPNAQIPRITVVDAEPPRLFSFRWAYPDDVAAGPTTALLVTFEIGATDVGSRLRMTETGFRELGWSEAVVADTHRDHERGWDEAIGRLEVYVGGLVAAG